MPRGKFIALSNDVREEKKISQTKRLSFHLKNPKKKKKRHKPQSSRRMEMLKMTEINETENRRIDYWNVDALKRSNER